MNKLTSYFFLIMIFFGTNVFSQKEGDLVFAKKVIQEMELSGEYLNQNMQELNLNEKEAYQLAIKYLRKTYGYWRIRSQRPHKIVTINNYWVIYGTLKKNKKGGVFMIVINSKNGAVEYMSHGK